MNLSEAVRKIGVEVGDLIEIVSRPHWLTKAIEKEEGGEKTSAEGQFVEITAIGETQILGYWLFGESIINGTAYSEVKWKREGSEKAIGGGSAVRKIGRKRRPSDPSPAEIFWLLPDLENVWTRCQK